MVRFAHIADSHLGGWKAQELQELNFESFRKTVDICLKSNLDFILFAGDIFDSAYPPIEILKEAFAQFKRIKEANLPCFIIAGSHDYSVSGKTFLDVLEKAGFCKNVFCGKDDEKNIILDPCIYQNIAIYGYPGRKSGLEVPDIRRIKLQDAPGMFKILMLHTTIDKVAGNLPIDSVESKTLPKADYYALGHIHIRFKEESFVYPGPVFPNNFKELEDLKCGSFVIVDTNAKNQIEHIKIPIKEVELFEFDFDDALIATDEIIRELSKRDLKDKVVLLRVSGEINRGKNSDIKFSRIEQFASERGAYVILRNTHDLKNANTEVEIKLKEEDKLEDEVIKIYSSQNLSGFNSFIPELINIMSIEKQEGETSENFNNRLVGEARRILNF